MMMHICQKREQIAFAQRRALKVFGEDITAKDIAEPLRSFDLEAHPENMLAIFDQTGSMNMTILTTACQKPDWVK